MNRFRLWLKNTGAATIILLIVLFFLGIIVGPYIIAVHFIHKYW